ncbi:MULTISPECIES: MOSC domain-containing protein [Mumia]|uniref:MOSC domain-containing protein n=1 Tax=Mumia TaxID=1546255 RepID=UPI001420AB61|nr:MULTISPECIES: MOSC N-terminal beta barrel domain-containing protein [unclassified Mumia]QMW66188.1 MOSC domain-containing protein [Mumia sp. ZJ1417]
MRIASLHLYPVKSTAPHDVDRATVEPWGLAGDRRWLVIGPDGRKVDALAHPRILAVHATPTVDGLLLRSGGLPDLLAPRPVHGVDIPVGISRQDALRYAGEDAETWISKAIGTAARLVWQEDPTLRPMSATHGGTSGEPLTLADTAPILLTTTSSLDQLNAWVAETPDPNPLSMRRFRPNVVVEADPDELAPFEEDGWRTVTLGDVPFRFAELCDRCAITLIDPRTLVRGKEPIRTLSRTRKWDGVTWFGVRMVPTTIGTLQVGDPVSVTRALP